MMLSRNKIEKEKTFTKRSRMIEICTSQDPDTNKITNKTF